MRLADGAGRSRVTGVDVAERLRSGLDDNDPAPTHKNRLKVILVGAEGTGLSEATIAESDVRVRIPIDPRADSLNVVVAASIALSAVSGPQTAN